MQVLCFGASTRVGDIVLNGTVLSTVPPDLLIMKDGSSSRIIVWVVTHTGKFKSTY